VLEECLAFSFTEEGQKSNSFQSGCGISAEDASSRIPPISYGTAPQPGESEVAVLPADEKSSSRSGDTSMLRFVSTAHRGAKNPTCSSLLPFVNTQAQNILFFTNRFGS